MNILILENKKTKENSRELVCPECDVHVGHIYFGDHTHGAVCKACDIINVGIKEEEVVCHMCGQSTLVGHKPIPPNSPIPKHCKECTEKFNQHMDMHKRGYVFWQCEDCERSGYFPPNDKLVERLKQIYADQRGSVPAKAPFLMSFNKTICPFCGEDKEPEILQ